MEEEYGDAMLDLELRDEDFGEDLQAEFEDAQEDLLDELWALVEDVLAGDEAPEDAEAELIVDLQEWLEEEHQNPFQDDEDTELARYWREGTEMILDGYDLMLIALAQNLPEELQEGYYLVEDGLKLREQLLCVDDA